MNNIKNGFTLIELMVTIAIVAILTAVAYPSYQNSVCKTVRKSAQGDLLDLTQSLERFYTVNNFSYEGALLTTNGAGENVIGINFAPSDRSANRAAYNISLETEKDSFRLIALADGPGACDSHGMLQITSNGSRSEDKNFDGAFGGADEDNWD